MELGIKGHETRGDEVIKILETLGGKNHYKIKLTGDVENHFYYITNHYKDINNSYIGPDEIKGYMIFSLEDFLEKFPYKVGDKVNVWINYDYFGGRAELEDAEIKSMRWNSARCEIAYKMKDITREFYKDDIKGKVNDDEEHKTDASIDYGDKCNNGKIIEKSEMNMNDNNVDLTLKISTCYVLPDGFHFADENGNVIDANKILLVKNAPYYPTSYNECCDVLSMEYVKHYNLRYFTYERGFYEYATTDKLCSLQDKLNILGKLIICRNAYWKIAGDELGLGKPWEPDWDNLSTNHEFIKINKGCFTYSSRLLVFPTIEMRDAFYNNFKFLIEQCKELL